ncbi:electron transport complex subunit RsxC [Viscerimonas tarda]
MIKTFRKGGIHPPANKLSANKRIERIALPDRVVVPVSQHIGKPAALVVNKGDAVKVGTLLAKADGFVSANIHSPVSGKVLKIEDTLDSSGYKRLAIHIDVEGDVWEEGIDQSDTFVKECRFSPEEIKEKILAAGIVGMGGATFPLHVKLSPPPGQKAEYLLINAVECEPFLTCDHELMLEKGEEIIVGISILMKAAGVEKARIGIEVNKPDAIAKLGELAKEYKGIEVTPLKVRYPQGGEKQLIEATTGRCVPGGALPIAVGAVVANVATAFAVYEAVQKNKPLFERVVTVTGKHVAKPCNLYTRMGVPLSYLIDYAGGLPEDTGKVIGGGPMMGKALIDTSIPVTKGTSGILIVPSLEAQRKEMHNCIRCTKCVSVCCMGLSPHLLMTTTEFADWDKAEAAHITDCVECGSCSYTCPANRPLLDYIRLGKKNVLTIARARKN